MEAEKKPIRCRTKGCNRRFRTPEALKQHKLAKHDFTDVDVAQISATDFSAMYGDLPDGAFFAMAEEMGISIEDFAEEG